MFPGRPVELSILLTRPLFEEHCQALCRFRYPDLESGGKVLRSPSVVNSVPALFSQTSHIE